MCKRTAGFTLIELVLVTTIVAILAAIAIPSYQNFVLSSRRADAMAGLGKIQLAEEKWRANNTAYTTSFASLDVSSTSPDGYYILTIPTASATSYMAVAAPTGPQVKDTECGSFAIALNNTVDGPLTYSSSYADAECWER